MLVVAICHFNLDVNISIGLSSGCATGRNNILIYFPIFSTCIQELGRFLLHARVVHVLFFLLSMLRAKHPVIRPTDVMYRRVQSCFREITVAFHLHQDKYGVSHDSQP